MNAATRNARAGLWEKASELPDAADSDFFGARRRPPGVDPGCVKIINDTALRTRLIELGIAEGLQSPKGPQKIPSIIRLYPDFDAPGNGISRPARITEPVRTAYGLPTVEELTALLARIAAAEEMARAQLRQQIDADIARLKREVGAFEGDAFERAFRELDRALTARKTLTSQVREQAFRDIEADESFAPRKFLRLISRAPKE